MDTNLKRSHKLTSFIIALCILIPATLVTSLYPRTGAAMEKLRTEYEEVYNESTENLYEWCVEGDFVNYAVEASYYMYGFVLQECENRAVDFSVLDEYGWDSDYHTIISECDYLSVYKDVVGVPEISINPSNENTAYDYDGTEIREEMTSAEEPEFVDTMTQHDVNTSQATISIDKDYVIQEVYANGSNPKLLPLLENDTLTPELLEEMDYAGIKAYLVLEYDAYGKLAVADMKFTSDFVRYYHGNNIYSVAKKSVNQYENNVKGYIYEFGASGDYYQVIPKNFRVVFLIRDSSGFIYQENYNPYHVFTSWRLFWETGVVILIAGIALIVAACALLLPFIKRLNTGWERLFSIHIETVFCLAVLYVMLAYFMLQLMSVSNMYDILREIKLNGDIEMLGYTLSPVSLYCIILGCNFIGWSICFFMEYIIIAAIRQFLSRPMYYLTHRFLIINIIKWMFKPFRKLYNYVTDIDITNKLKNSILKIVLVNFVLVSVLCCMWLVGLPGVIIYSIALYIFLKKFGSKIQKQYYSIINATKQMAEGDLKIKLEDDLGMFTPFGEALTKVSQGFSKAVAEEAKSQQMKTELITNVSHDLKTPLTAIITYVDLLKNPNITPEEYLSYVETLDQKTQRLKVLIEDLFEVSKAQSGNIQMNFMDVDVVSLMKQVRLEMEDQIVNSGLYFRWNLPEDKLLLHLDGQRTYRVFENLINNILKYSMPGSRVFIDITENDNAAYISFKNISMAELDFDVERLTDRFVRGDESRNTEGSGLGLAIAKSFVELQNGIFKIDVDGDLFKVIIIWPK